MNISDHSKLDANIDTLQHRTDKSVAALEFAASQLNLAFDFVWSLPDDELRELLQSMVMTGKFAKVFGLHAKTAAGINEALVGAGRQPIAKTVVPREYEISPEGVVTLKPLPEPEPIDEPLPDPEP